MTATKRLRLKTAKQDKRMNKEEINKERRAKHPEYADKWHEKLLARIKKSREREADPDFVKPKRLKHRLKKDPEAKRTKSARALEKEEEAKKEALEKDEKSALK
jgi:hypothetical protein